MVSRIFFTSASLFTLCIRKFYLFNYYYFKYFTYLSMRDTERQRHRQREKQALRREPDSGLDPRTLGSRPELKADAQLLSHPGVPIRTF